MQKNELLEYGNYYHIYNRGINSCNLFEEARNYEYFLRLYERHVSSVAITYSWVLMKNHFHFLVKIRDSSELLSCASNDSLSESLLPKPHQYFSNLFNAYAKAYNKRYSRHGGLFERPFKRKLITCPEYLKQIVVYIHNNPIRHGCVDDLVDYPWSSYHSCISEKPIKTQNDLVIKWFKNNAGFKQNHLTGECLNVDDEWLGI